MENFENLEHLEQILYKLGSRTPANRSIKACSLSYFSTLILDMTILGAYVVETTFKLSLKLSSH